MVPEANNLLWAARNPSRPVLVPRAPLNVMQKGHSNVQRASRKISAQQRKEAEDALHMAIQKALSEHEEKTNHLAIEHGITVEKVKKLMGGERHYKGNQNAQLANALVHAKAQEVNADQPRCTKYSLNKICEMVKDDEDMQNLNHVDRREYIQKLNEHRVLQHMSIHATNTVAAHNVQSTLDTIFKMLDNLAVRTGIYACLFASCGHVYDTAEATWFRTDNIMDFWEDVVQMEADEITQKLEQWACMTGLDERETVQNMQCVCTRLLNSGLRTIVKRRDIHINYTNFDTAIKEKLGINLRGWPEDMAFQSPTSINDLNALLKLRNSLKDSSCRWFHMSPHQREEYNLQLTACRKKGEVIGKPWKKCSDAGVPRKCKGKENKCQSKRVRGSGSSVQAPKSAEFVDSSDEEYTSEDEA
ncbi:uncharacterized protein F5891DRAFT_946951 [Suillus fuscotomentosus]|uniref:Uncharacterized protein n=1 Tax=Suillus fuscotomentosus TaxID=1912939 RepID=A0AAD4HQ77_9AGAM|nr:uncharacterized protein F5891DRAFT_946951 [Suillus fuscotomentosus]KAG1903494.1 hypothetical protein F5891DRAFT_946951 [Suillus fuscotomentosus]